MQVHGSRVTATPHGAGSVRTPWSQQQLIRPCQRLSRDAPSGHPRTCAHHAQDTREKTEHETPPPKRQSRVWWNRGSNAGRTESLGLLPVDRVGHSLLAQCHGRMPVHSDGVLATWHLSPRTHLPTRVHQVSSEFMGVTFLGNGSDQCRRLRLPVTEGRAPGVLTPPAFVS